MRERERERRETREKERENERREIEEGDSPESSIEGWVAVERDRKRKGKAMHKLRERRGLFFTFGWLVCQQSDVIHLSKNGRKQEKSKPEVSRSPIKVI